MVADDVVAKTRWFVLLVALGVGCRLRGVDGLRITFKVGVDDERAAGDLRVLRKCWGRPHSAS